MADPNLLAAADQYDHDQNVQSAQGNLVGAQDVSTDDAVEALRHAPSFGVKPAAVMQSPKPLKDAVAQQQQATQLQRPGVASFVASDPAKAAAVKDDLGPLGFIESVVKKGIFAPAEQATAGAGPHASLLDKAADAYMGPGKLTNEVLSAPLSALTRVGGELLSRIIPGPVKNPASVFNPEQTFTTQSEKSDFFTSELGIASLGLAARVPGRGVAIPRNRPDASSFSGDTRPPAPPTADGFTTDPHGFVTAADGTPATFETPQAAATWKRAQAKEGNFFAGGPDLHPETGEIGWRMYQPEPTEAPMPGSDPVQDSVYKASAEEGDAWLKQAEDAVVESKTHTRDPGLIEDFVENHVAPEQTVSVNGQALLDLWNKLELEGGLGPGDKFPFYDNGGSILNDQIFAAAESGGNVEIPLSKWLAEAAGQPWADELRKNVAVGNGVSPEEAKTLPEPAFTEEAFQKAISNDPELLKKVIQAAAPEGSTPDYLHHGTMVEALNKFADNPSAAPSSIKKILNHIQEKELEASAPKEGSPSEDLAEGLPEINQDTLDELQAQGLSPSDFQNFLKGQTLPEPEGLPLDTLSPEELQQFNAARASVRKAAKEAQLSFFKQLIREPKALDMTAKQYAGYAVRVHKAYNDLVQKLWKQTFEKVRKQYTAEWKAAYHENFSPTLEELMDQPVMRAEHMLRYSKGEEDQLARETKLKDEKGKPLTFYHGSSMFNIGTPENPWTPSGEPVISFTYDPKFADKWRDYDLKDDYGEYQRHEYSKKGRTIYVVNILAKNPADFRKPADALKAARWYAEFGNQNSWKHVQTAIDSGDETGLRYLLNDLGLEAKISKDTKELFISRRAAQIEPSLSRGRWTLWENPTMMKALGWDAVHMKESPESPSLNIAVADGKLVYFRYRMMEGGKTWRLDPAIRDQFPKWMTEHLPKNMFSKEHAVPAAELAAEFGFDSPETMLQELSRMEVNRGDVPFRQYVKQTAERITRDRTIEQVGDLLHPDRIMADAKALFTSPEAMDLLTADFRLLAEKTGSPLTREDVEKMANEKFAQLPLKRAVNLRNFEGAARRWGNKVEEAMVKGKPDFLEAFKAKQYQMMNVVQTQRSIETADLLRKWGAKFQTLASSKTIPGIEQSHLDAIHGELRQYGYNVPKSNLAYSYSKWRQEQIDAGAIGIPEEEPIPTGTALKDLTVEQFEALVDRVKNMEHWGREAQKILIGDQKTDLALLAKEAVAGKPPLQKIHDEAVVKAPFVERAELALSKPEFLFDLLDNYNPNGVFNRVLQWGARTAHADEHKINTTVFKRLGNLINGVPESTKARWSDPIPKGHGLTNPNNGREITLSRTDLIGVYLNSKSEINRWHLEEGGWQWDKDHYEQLLDHYLSAEDRKMADGVLDLLEDLWPVVATTEHNLTGLVPPKIKNYFPLRPDSYRSLNLKETEISDTMAEGFMRDAATPTGHLKARTWTKYPVNLDWQATLFDHLRKMAKRAAYGPWVQDVNKFMRDPTIRSVIRDVLGPGGDKEIKDSVRRQVGYRLVDPRAIDDVSKFIRGVREHTYMVQAGFNPTVLAEHASAISQTLTVVGPKYSTLGLLHLSMNPLGLYKEVHELSDYMADRVNEVTRELRDIHDDLQRVSTKSMNPVEKGTHEIAQAIRLGASKALSFVNHYIIAVPTWKGAYIKALDEGMTPEEAIQSANKAVAKSHSSGAEMDMSRFQAGSELIKTLNMYYSYHNTNLNLGMEGIRRAQIGGKENRDWVARAAFFLLFVSPLVGSLMRGHYPKKLTPQDIAAWVASSMMETLTGGVPLVRQLWSALEGKASGSREWNFEFLPSAEEFVRVAKLTEDAAKVAKNTGTGHHWNQQLEHDALRNTIEALGFLLYLPTGAPARTSQVVYDMHKPKPSVGRVQQPVQALIYGPSHERPRR